MVDYDLLEHAIRLSGFTITEVVCGEATGIDALGSMWAVVRGIKKVSFTPDWRYEGPIAGYLRNNAMAVYADALIAVWDGVSKGTSNMISVSKQKQLKVYVHRTELIQVCK